MTDGAMQPYGLTLDKFLTHASKWHPDAQVVTQYDIGDRRRVAYRQLQERAARISTVLLDFGSGQGESVATLAWNTHSHVELLYGIVGIGAVCHTLNPRLGARQTCAMLNQSGSGLLVTSADLWPLAEEILADAPAVRKVLVIDGAAPARTVGAGRIPALDLDELIANTVAHRHWGDFDESTPSGLCFTSGVTGAPKGVTYTHRSSYLHTLRLLQADVMAISNRDRVLVVVPLFHANAWGLPFATAAVGAKLVLNGRRTDGAALEALINAEGVTVAVGIATVWLGLVEHLETTGADVPSLSRIIVGGAPLPQALMERIEARLRVRIQTSWGMTELSPCGTVAGPHDETPAAALSGRPAIGVDLLLTDAEGHPLPQQRDVEGHLRARGSSVVARYFGSDSPATDESGWFPTGDLARIDAAGNLTITGRSKNLIKSGGEWINPGEIESIVGALPQVSLCAVLGRRHAKWGERPVLFVTLRDEGAISDAALLASLDDRVPSWWMPDAIVRLAIMPLTPTGKIDRIRLRADHDLGAE